DTDCLMRDCRNKGETPLHRAAAFGSEQVIDLLLDTGAHREAKDENGDSPLTWASWHLRPDAVLRRLCYDGFSIHPERRSSYDHGGGWEIVGATKADVEHERPPQRGRPPSLSFRNRASGRRLWKSSRRRRDPQAAPCRTSTSIPVRGRHMRSRREGW